MRLLGSAIVLFLASASALAGDAPKYAPHVSRMATSHAFFKKNDAPDFWKLIGYYIPQTDLHACAPTALTMLLNAMRADRALGASDKLITGKDLVAKVDISKEGSDPGVRGVSLEGFGRILATGMKKFEVEGWSHEVVRTTEHSDAALKKLRDLLARNEKSGDDFIMPLYFQADITGDPEGAVGHFAPIAAFDGKRVLLLDPDREWYEPYWVPLEILYKGMTNSRMDAGKAGGYIRVWRNSPPAKS
ncbi:MAG TPA: phytochelatin synthase family protein [Bdellovibrionota bacterium]|nr:phytochelatin synthase family protein [Bdellovibrionota bacterium]